MEQNFEQIPDPALDTMRVGYEDESYWIGMDMYGAPLTHRRFRALCDLVENLKVAYDAIDPESLERFAEEQENIRRGYNADGSDPCRPPRPKRTPRPGYVYLAHIETGQFKIGRSVTPEKRIKHFGTKMPVAIDLVHVFYCDDYVLAEKRLHAMFDAVRVEGEWFDLTPCEVACLRSIDFYEGGDYWAIQDEDGEEVIVNRPVPEMPEA